MIISIMKGRKIMGEVRTKVRLLNAVDEALTRRNLLKAEEIRTYFANALVGFIKLVSLKMIK